MMLRPILPALLLLALAACGKEEAKAPEDDGSGPQTAISLDDYAMPVDKSAEVTAIGAATGDASGMPRDGGRVVEVPKAEPRAAAETPVVAAPAAAPANLLPPPMVVPPAPPAPVPAGQ